MYYVKNNEEKYQEVWIPNYCAKYSLEGIYSELTKIEAVNIEELVILHHGESVKTIEIIANPKILEIPQKSANIISINGVKLTELLCYKLRKTFRTCSQYVQDYE